MKLASFSKLIMAAALALFVFGGAAVARNAGSGAQSGSQDKAPQKKASDYPNATRKAPKLDLAKQEDADQINKGLTAINNGNMDQARQILQPFADGKASDSKYAQVLALQGLASIEYKAGDTKKAIPLLKKALALNVMPNDTYFQLQYELAQFYLIDGQYQKSLDTVKQWREQGKRETADSYALEGKDYYQLGQYKQAITVTKKAIAMSDSPKASWNQVLAASYAETGNSGEALKTAKAQLAKHPNDMTTLHNTVSLLVSSDKYDEALDLMKQAETKGNFTTDKDYFTLAKLHLMKAQDADNPKPEARDAVKVIKDGMAKGKVKPGYQAYKIQGDAAFLSDDINSALADYAKASKDAPDGELDLQRAKLLLSQNKYSSGRAAARKALTRGLKHKGEAYVVIAKSERALHNRTAAIKAMRKAKEDPTTHAQAQAWLQKVGG